MRIVILAVITVALLLGVIELAFRISGGFPVVETGMSSTEFQWKVQRAEAAKNIFVIGDSRIGWGFAERIFSEEIAKAQSANIVGFNAGLPGTSATSLVRYIVAKESKTKPGIMVINFSPGGFYFFPDYPVSPADKLKYQDILDDKIRIFLQERIYTFDREYTHLYKQFKEGKHPSKRDAVWMSRTVFPDGFINAHGQYNDGTPFDPAEYQLKNYEEILKRISSNQQTYLARKEAAVKTIQQAKDAGWKIVIIRLPVGPRMRQLEEQLPQQFRLETVAGELGLEYIDYNQDMRVNNLSTLDESHLTPESAREMARILALDLLDLLFK